MFDVNYHREMDRYDREEAHAARFAEEYEAIDAIEADIKVATDYLLELARKHGAYYNVGHKRRVAATYADIEGVIRDGVFDTILFDLRNIIEDDDRP